MTAAEMAISGNYGIELDLRRVPRSAVGRDDFVLFSESNSRFLLEISDKAEHDFEALMRGKICAKIGTVTKTSRLCVNGLDGEVALGVPIKDLRASWKQTLSSEA